MSQLLNRKKTEQKISRIAYQIIENNFTEKEIIIAGIEGEGFSLAELIVKELVSISEKKIFIAKVSINKLAKFQPELTITCEVDTFKKKTVVLVDDVLNTGRTLAFSLRPFLSIELKALQVAVLVDRNHPSYPISADYVGYSLSTTLNDHIKVVLSDKNEFGVYIF